METLQNVRPEFCHRTDRGQFPDLSAEDVDVFLIFFPLFPFPVRHARNSLPSTAGVRSNSAKPTPSPKTLDHSQNYERNRSTRTSTTVLYTTITTILFILSQVRRHSFDYEMSAVF